MRQGSLSWHTASNLLVLSLLLLLFALLVFSVGGKSPTLDEQNHITRGLAYLQTGDLRLSQEHPPGVNVWEAWPLLVDPEIRLPLDSPSWANAEWYGFADQFLWQVNDQPQAIVLAARVPIMWISLLLAGLACRWARELGGDRAGLIALALLVLDPNLLAHGRLATNDVGVTCAVFAAMFALWRAIRQPSWWRWMVAGVLFGLAQLSKFSALVLGPVLILVFALAWLRSRRRTRSSTNGRPGAWLKRLLVVLAVGFAVVWAGYGFSWAPVAALGGIPGPAPAYWGGIQTILKRTSGGNPTFLLGQVSTEGWWTYFPVAFAVKTPLPTLLILGAALVMWMVSAIRRRARARRGNAGSPVATPSAGTSHQPPDCAACLILPALAFWGMALSGSFQVGYRHILPTLPFLYVLAGWQVGKWADVQLGKPQAGRARAYPLAISLIGLALVTWLAWGTASIAPHYLAFFNVLAGGPDGGYRVVVDSNLDWGQDMPGIKEYVDAHDVERIYLSWFGAAHPEAYDFPFHPLPGFWRFRGDPAIYGFNPYAPAPGLYAISASNLQGVALEDPDLYAWFRGQTPTARIGHSVFVYEVVEERTCDGAVVLGVPFDQLAEPERSLLAQACSIRRYDPETGTIRPDAAHVSTVWFVAPEPTAQAMEAREGPGYHVSREMVDPEGAPAQPLARFGETVTLAGFELPEAIQLGKETALPLRAEWIVLQPPHRAAVSFAHLLDAEGGYVAGWDGMTAPATCWQEGDRITQQYPISLPQDLATGTYRVEVGWYDAEDVARWPAYASGEPVGDRFLLPPIEVRQ